MYVTKKIWQKVIFYDMPLIQMVTSAYSICCNFWFTKSWYFFPFSGLWSSWFVQLKKMKNQHWNNIIFFLKFYQILQNFYKKQKCYEFWAIFVISKPNAICIFFKLEYIGYYIFNNFSFLKCIYSFWRFHYTLKPC